jgi:peptidoglycan/xylan/chitin deacetylase (PgdA/CDA1 family)
MLTLLPILCYHHIGVRHEPHGERGLWVSMERFTQHMNLLVRLGYQSITLGQLGEVLSGRMPRPRRAVVLTFDDAYDNFNDWAWPVLRERGMTATVFVVTGLVGGRSEWDGEDAAPLMDWPTLGRLAKAGVECASHTVSHPHLSQVSPEVMSEELSLSRQTLEHELGQSVTTLAYPSGDFNPAVIAAARHAGYQTACTIQRGNRHGPATCMSLKRVPIDENVTVKRLRRRLRIGYDYEWRLHHALGRE